MTRGYTRRSRRLLLASAFGLLFQVGSAHAFLPQLMSLAQLGGSITQLVGMASKDPKTAQIGQMISIFSGGQSLPIGGPGSGYPPTSGYPPSNGSPPGSGYPPPSGYPPSGGYPPTGSPGGQYSNLSGSNYGNGSGANFNNPVGSLTQNRSSGGINTFGDRYGRR